MKLIQLNYSLAKLVLQVGHMKLVSPKDHNLLVKHISISSLFGRESMIWGEIYGVDFGLIIDTGNLIVHSLFIWKENF